MKLLHINSSVLGPHSVSRQVSAAIVDRLRKATPGLDIVYRDLTLTPLAHLSGSHLAAAQGAAPEAFAAAGPRRRSGRAGRVSGRRHRRARRAHVQFYDPKPAQGLDRPHPGGGQNVQIRRAGCRRVGRQQARYRRDLTRRILRRPARRPPWANIWKLISLGVRLHRAWPIPNSFPPMESRWDPSIARKQWQAP